MKFKKIFYRDTKFIKRDDLTEETNKMASTNQSPQYQKAEVKFLAAQKEEDKLFYLEEMIRECPKHKSAEKMLAQLKTRRKKLLEKIEKNLKKKRRKGQRGIKKESMQVVIIGFTNSGKSSLLASLTNASPEIASYNFTTKEPIVGMMAYKGSPIQIIEIPSIGSEYYDKGLVNTADTVLILVTSIEQIIQVKKYLDQFHGKVLIVFNIKDPGKVDKRKTEATLRSKKYNFVIISTKIKKDLEELREKIFQSFNKIRVYTKEPGKERSNKPLIFNPGTIVKEVAEKIFKASRAESIVKEAKITGPSSKFPNQKVGLDHVLKDLDVIEFKTG